MRVISRILLCFHATKFDIDRDKGDVLAKVVIKKRVNVFLFFLPKPRNLRNIALNLTAYEI